MSDLISSIRENYQKTLDAITASARKAGREPDSIRLVVVTKLQPIEVVQAAIEAGAKILGENYPEEAVQKITELKSQTSVKPSQFAVEWHIIGHVQSRKARLVAEHFALFQSLDSLKLAERVDHFAAEFNRVLPVLLEFNVGGEESKSGWDASDRNALGKLLNDVNAVASLTGSINPMSDLASSIRERYEKTLDAIASSAAKPGAIPIP